jgi:hypothetical protein
VFILVVCGLRGRIWGVSILLLLAAASAMIWLVNRLPLTACGFEVPESSKEHKFQAVQVVVRPWQGQHNVYGIFMIPERYKHGQPYVMSLKIQGFTTKFSAVSAGGEDRDNIVVEQGHYLQRAYVPTRNALWFLFTGRFGDLRAPCHWWLVISDRER